MSTLDIDRAGRIALFGIIAIVLVIGTWLRFDKLSEHFTHADDIGVAFSILTADDITIGRIKEVIYDSSRRSYTGPRSKFLRFLDRNGFLEPLASTLQSPIRSLAVSAQWTYAPLQFFATSALLRPNMEYEDILWYGRLPSALFSVLNLILLVWLLGRLYRESNWPLLVLLPLSVLAFSWENIIYAKQMENYSLVVTGCLALSLALISTVENGQSRRRLLLFGVAGFLGAIAHYQIIFILPAALLGVAAGIVLPGGFSLARLLKALVRVLKYSALPMAVLISPVLFFFVLHKGSSGIGWNAGPNGEYLFPLPVGDSFIQFMQLAGNFLVLRLPEAVDSIIAFSPSHPSLTRLFSLALLSLALFGAASLVRERNPARFSVMLFASGSVLTHFVMVLLRQIPLSPTRHSLILLPFLLLLACQGLHAFWRLIEAKRISTTWSPSLTLTVIVAALIPGYLGIAQEPVVSRQRLDAMQQFAVEKLIARNKVDLVISDGLTFNPFLMKYPRENASIFISGIGFANFLPKHPVKSVAFVSTRGPISPERRLDLHDQAIEGLRGLNMSSLPSKYVERVRLEVSSDVEVCFLTGTRNGTNGIYFYIFTVN